jgi:hypothetical protein
MGTQVQACRGTEIEISGPQSDILMSQKARNLYLAGQGGGKTFTMGALSFLLVNAVPEALGNISANTKDQLTNSTLKEIFHVWKMMGWTEWSVNNPKGYYVINKEPPVNFVPHGHTFENNNRKIFLKNGAVIMTASLENYRAIEGQTFSWSMLDETSDTKEEAVKDVITGRLRENMLFPNIGPDKLACPWVKKDHPFAGPVAVNPLYIFTKPAKEQWLLEYFNLPKYETEIISKIYDRFNYFKKYEENHCVVIASAFWNADIIGEETIQLRLSELSSDKADLLIYANPFAKSGVEYYSAFNTKKHIQKCRLTKGYPLHFTLDFNVNPYMSGQVWQIVPEDNRIKVRCLAEYALVSPKNSIDHVCEAIVDDWEHVLDTGLYYYGDASGKNRLPLKDVRSYFDIVEKKLQKHLFNDSRRILKQNPRHRTVGSGKQGRRDLMNALLKGAKDVDIEIDPSCKYTIADFQYIKEDENGAKRKHEEMINGVRCQKYGHMSDASDALLCFVFGDYTKD